MVKAAILAPVATVERVYTPEHRQRIASRCDLFPQIIAPDRMNEYLTAIGETEVIFSTWGMPRLTPSQLDALTKLRVVFYAAGSVQGFAPSLLERGITVVSAWHANAVPVSEFVLSQILLAGKGYFRNLREYTGAPGSFPAAYRGPGNHHTTVALLGYGAVGRAVRALLRPFRLSVLVYDPFLDPAVAVEHDVEPVTIEAAFERSVVVSNHLADKPEIAGRIRADLLRRLPNGGVFINSGRGRTVSESDLAEVMAERPDLTALLDVTHPEPAAPDSPLHRLPNVLISTHIAGPIGAECGLLADLCVEEFDRYLVGEPLRHRVTAEMLPRLA
ncbi:MAG: hydroxyacid dehydrogenase [Capsulimonadales bacterium]|nr:hydroxyacid dehydrogenase [Capsulimonadales bacterium]